MYVVSVGRDTGAAGAVASRRGCDVGGGCHGGSTCSVGGCNVGSRHDGSGNGGGWGFGGRSAAPTGEKCQSTLAHHQNTTLAGDATGAADAAAGDAMSAADMTAADVAAAGDLAAAAWQRRGKNINLQFYTIKLILVFGKLFLIMILRHRLWNIV